MAADDDMAVSKKSIVAGIPIEENTTPVLEAVAVDDIEANANDEMEQLRREMEEQRNQIPVAVVTERKSKKRKRLVTAMFIIAIVLVLVFTLGGSSDDDSKKRKVPIVEDTPQPTTSTVPTAAPTIGFTMPRFDANFNRISTFPLCLQLDPTCSTDEKSAGEVIVVSDDGMSLAYTDIEHASIGFVNITDPANPAPAGLVNLAADAKPTSLVFKGKKYVVTAVDTSPDFINPSGNLQVLDMDTLAMVATIDMGGQPNSIALSPDGNYMAVAIENQRDEDVNDGALPQNPPGFLQVVNCSADDPTAWTNTKVEMANDKLDRGISYNSDPEPEFVAINSDNIAVVTLQENNGIVLVDLASAQVVTSFSAGFATVNNVDVTEEKHYIEQSAESSLSVAREPDGVTWIGTDYFATADEGDLDGGGRGFTIFDKTGTVIYTSGNMMDELAIRFGHYPDTRSGNRGNEPENILYAEFEALKLLFVGSERSNLVFVFEVSDVRNPIFRQVLPTTIEPEGMVAIPSRNLLVAVSGDDNRSKNIRSAISVYQLWDVTPPVYPSMFSANGDDGNPIPFSALSGLSWKDGMLYTIEDSFYKKTRVLTIDPSSYPYKITAEIHITDANDVLSSVLDEAGRAVIMNSDQTVNLDLEGIEAVEDGFWLVHEGTRTPNLLLKVDATGVIIKAVTLPEEVNMGKNSDNGFTGVAVEEDYVVVCFQRAWSTLGDTGPRLGIYNAASNEWKFVFYPLDSPASQNGGWVGLSDIASFGNGAFLLLESDNQGSTDSAIKKIYRIELGDYSIIEGETVSKTFVHDLIPDLSASGRLVPEKVEGLTVDGAGNIWVNNDNEGVDDNSGEQMLIQLGPLN